MFRALVCVAASLLLVGTLYSEDKAKNVVTEKKPEAEVDAATKESTEAKSAPARPRDARRKGLRGEAAGHRGKITKASLEKGVLRLTMDDKDYEFTVGEHTHAMLRTMEKEGKEVIIGVTMFNGEGRRGARTRPTTKANTK